MIQVQAKASPPVLASLAGVLITEIICPPNMPGVTCVWVETREAAEELITRAASVGLHARIAPG